MTTKKRDLPDRKACTPRLGWLCDKPDAEIGEGEVDQEKIRRLTQKLRRATNGYQNQNISDDRRQAQD